MVQNCPRCGTPNTAGHRFCSNCGAPQTVPGAGSTTSNTAAPSTSGTFTVRAVDDAGAADNVQLGDAAAPEGLAQAGDDRAPMPGSRQPMSGEVTPSSGIGRPMTSAVPGDLPPNAGERPGQATYVPYSNEATRQLDKQTSGNAWLVPTIAIAAVLLALLVAATLYLLFNTGSGSNGAGASNQTVSLPCTLPAAATVEQQIIYTVCRSSEEQIQAWRDLNPDVLRGTRTGKDLDDNLRKIAEFKANNQYADAVLHQLVVTALNHDEQSAVVETSEVWSVTYYNKADNSVVQKSERVRYSETYSLVKQSDKWYVQGVKVEEQPKDGN